MINLVNVDAKVQSDVKALDELISFNVSVLTGTFRLPDNSMRNRYTYIRVIYDGDDVERLKRVVKTNRYIRIYGSLDSEQYEAASGKRVYNKVIRAHKIAELQFNRETKQLEEKE